MWKGARSSAVGVFVLLIGVGPAAAQAVVDQEQPAIDASIGGLAAGGIHHQYVAQVFTVGVTASPVALEVPLVCRTAGTAAGPLIERRSRDKYVSRSVFPGTKLARRTCDGPPDKEGGPHVSTTRSSSSAHSRPAVPTVGR
jgi:hypothetical protein